MPADAKCRPKAGAGCVKAFAKRSAAVSGRSTRSPIAWHDGTRAVADQMLENELPRLRELLTIGGVTLP